MGIFKGDFCFGAREAELASLLQMVIIVTVIAASCGLIVIRYSSLSFVGHAECVTCMLLIIAHDCPM